MRMLLVGSELIADKMSGVLKEHFPELDCHILRYDKYTDIVDILREHNRKEDAVLFAGKAPYWYYETHGDPSYNKLGLMDYVPRHRTTLYKALLEITYKLRCDLSRISVDTYDEEMFKSVYKDLHVDYDSTSMQFATQKLISEDYAEYLLEFHQRNIASEKSDCCITGVAEVYDKLREMDIPCVLAVPEEELIKHSIRNLQVKVIANQNSENQIVVIAVKIEHPCGHASTSEDEYLFLSRRIKIMDRLYIFSNRIAGIVVERGTEFIIFTTRKQIEQESDNYRHLSLRSSLKEVDMVNSSIGIGYGMTANEAKVHAFKSLKYSQDHGPESAFVTFENADVIGPIVAPRDKGEKETIDKRFYKIAKDADISVNTVHKVFSKVINEKNPEFTSKELAILTGLSVRTMDRIIQKLEAAGYCEVVSEKLMNKHGRPSRILRFELTNLK